MSSRDREELMMRLPLQITFRQMQPSLALEARIRVRPITLTKIRMWRCETHSERHAGSS
ncbi:MAG TPA: hypothetical protein VN750_18370 [Steroidobacteraceae bacterium]|nr:hypothetical protein [Steroidobacteraceae bacterium]